MREVTGAWYHREGTPRGIGLERFASVKATIKGWGRYLRIITLHFSYTEIFYARKIESSSLFDIKWRHS
jgi:hypothetical protein